MRKVLGSLIEAKIPLVILIDVSYTHREHDHLFRNLVKFHCQTRQGIMPAIKNSFTCTVHDYMSQCRTVAYLPASNNELFELLYTVVFRRKVEFRLRYDTLC